MNKGIAMAIAASAILWSDRSIGQEEPTSHELWMQLSVQCQRIALKTAIHHRERDFEADPDRKRYGKEQDAINALIKQLVRLGALQEKTFVLRPLNELKETKGAYHAHERLAAFHSRIEPRFGYFVALQLMGSRMYPADNDPDKPSHRIAALPPQLLADFEEHLRSADLLLLDSNAEQNGCRQRLEWHLSCHRRLSRAVA